MTARLRYALRETGECLDYQVKLVAKCPHYGGLRWWFLYPLELAGRACRRRVRKLYLPPEWGV